MDQNQQNQSGAVPNNSAEFGSVPKGSEGFRTVPNPSETFGKVPNDSEGFRSVPKLSERKENHTLTVREAARMFEAAGVARTERSIVNWCQPNRTGIARLDSYFDPNERRYYVTPESVERAIQEEIAKAAKANDPSEPVGSLPKDSEELQKRPVGDQEASGAQMGELEKEVFDLRITNRAKDYFIDQLQKERNGLLDQLVQSSRKVGELETRLLQLKAPHPASAEPDSAMPRD
jgi:hypothetical protein